jgi:hypothetical protein
VTVAELKKILEHCNDGDEVVLVSQPYRTSPLEYQLYDADVLRDKVYLIEGDQVGYLENRTRRELGLSPHV